MRETECYASRAGLGLIWYMRTGKEKWHEELIAADEEHFSQNYK